MLQHALLSCVSVCAHAPCFQFMVGRYQAACNDKDHSDEINSIDNNDTVTR